VATVNRRGGSQDRRRVPRGGRRPYDRPGSYPPVLVADTDDGVRRAFVRYLNLFGFRVVETARIDEALDADGTLRPHVIVTELTSAAAARLASSSRVPTIVTVTDGIHPRPPFASALLVKPFPLPVLLDEVRRALRASSAATPALG
jgi:hypothetical protein